MIDIFVIPMIEKYFYSDVTEGKFWLNLKITQGWVKILVLASLQYLYHTTKAVQTMEGTCCGW